MNTAVWEQPNDDTANQASALSPEDREFVINKLAEMLVSEFQNSEQHQSVSESTVKEPPAFYREDGQRHHATVSERPASQAQRGEAGIQLYS